MSRVGSDTGTVEGEVLGEEVNKAIIYLARELKRRREKGELVFQARGACLRAGSCRVKLGNRKLLAIHAANQFESRKL